MEAPVRMVFTRNNNPEVIEKDLADLDLESLVREELEPLKNIKAERKEEL